jgi:L-lactate dehydrogenase complex protein LldG
MEGVERKRVGQKGRDAILARIRAAQPDRKPSHDVKLSQMFAPIGDVMARYREECKANLTELIETNSAAESAMAIGRILESLPEGRFFVQDDGKLRALVESIPHGRATVWSSAGAVPEDTQVTLTLAEALVAQTGSILSSSGCGGRGASAVPLCHVVYATTAQVMPDIEAALQFAQKDGITERSSYVGLISGSSRTADIEKILVQGAHGPRRLVVVMQRV